MRLMATSRREERAFFADGVHTEEQRTEADPCGMTNPIREAALQSHSPCALELILRSPPDIWPGLRDLQHAEQGGRKIRAGLPPSRRVTFRWSETSRKGTGLVVWAVCGPPVAGSIRSSALPWSAVINMLPPCCRMAA